MSIDTQTVDQVAHLARLEFDETNKARIINDMNRMLSFVEQLNQLDTSTVEPLIYMSDETNVLRKDEAQAGLPLADVLKNAPKKDSDYFKVPKVVEKK
ncbi:MAG: Asp-tRNA(Asn)/Glu-tRNA(Gln) amidotransferase subunit GatC [Bacteroidia bacterium]